MAGARYILLEADASERTHRERTPTVDLGPKSSLLGSVVGLFKNIVGAGVLALPGGVAAFTDRVDGLPLAVLLAVAMGALSGYCFWLIGRMCLITGATTYAGTLERPYGRHGRLIGKVVVVVKTGSACVVLSIILGDMLEHLAQVVGLHGVLGMRSILLWLLAGGVLLPLTLRRSFAALTPFAAFGILGTLYTMGFMGLRWQQGMYAEGGMYYDNIDRKPKFGQHGTQASGAIKLISMLSTAFLAHFNAPKFAHGLRENSQRRFGVMIVFAYVLVVTATCLVMSFGFLTFGGACRGLVLKNYAVEDPLVTIAVAATLLSVGMGYPFCFAAFRDDLMEMVTSSEASTGVSNASAPNSATRFVLTVALTVGVTAVAAIVDDLGFVVAIIGSVLATLIVYILPALAVIGIVGPIARSSHATFAERAEYVSSMVVFVVGIALGVIGTVVTVQEELD